MELLFAFYNVDFAKDLKISIQKSSDATVVDIVSSEEDLLTTLGQNPNINGVLLSTDLATKLKELRLEVLVDVLNAAREAFPNVTFTVLSNEKIGHPLLAELVEMGIYNIFVKSVDEFTIQSIYDSFIKPMSFTIAVKHRQVDPNIPWRRNLHKNTLRVEISNQNEDKITGTTNETSQQNQSDKKIDILKIKDKLPKFQSKKENLEIDTANYNNSDWLMLDDLSKVMNRKSEKIIGTVVIGVTSVAAHLGSTHSAISIANYLTRLGHIVALVEGNASLDFDRIHAMFEGEKRHILHESRFELNGIDHFKFREDRKLAEVFSIYEYVVMDLGVLQESPYLEEFNRSHVKCVVASPEEWKFHWLEEFHRNYGSTENHIYLLPGATNKSVINVADQLDYKAIYSFPIQESPYGSTKETKDLFGNIIGEFINKPSKTFSKGTLILTSAISVSITIFIVVVSLYLG